MPRGQDHAHGALQADLARQAVHAAGQSREADARFRRGGLDLRGVFARVVLDGAGLGSLGDVGRMMQGFYGEAAYDFLRRDRFPERRRALFLFARFERFDTNEEMRDGVPANPEAERTVLSGGLAVLPIEKVSLKADFEHWEDGADRQVNRFNLAAAFEF